MQTYSFQHITAAGLPLALALSASILCASANAQPHEVSRDGYTLRASTVVSTALDPRTASSHGVERSADRGVLNVTVERGRENVTANVSAVARNLGGVQQEIPMREAKAPNGMVSYVGAYEFAPREVLDFHVTARPRGHPTDLSLEFRDRMPFVR